MLIVEDIQDRKRSSIYKNQILAIVTTKNDDTYLYNISASFIHYLLNSMNFLNRKIENKTYD